MTLLQLKSNAPGLPGPYLQENLGPYRIMDEVELDKCTVVLAIGGRAKRRQVRLGTTPPGTYAVSLQKLGGNILVLDCELHLQPEAKVPRIMGGPRRGHYTYHLMRPPRKASQFAFGLYCDVLAMFSDLVIIFVEDFGGVEQVLRFICFWMRCAKAKGFPFQSRVLFVSTASMATHLDEFNIMAAMSMELRRDEPAVSYSAADIKSIMRRCFALIRVIDPFDLSKSFWQDPISASTAVEVSERTPLPRNTTVIRAAIANYLQQPLAAFNAFLACRVHRPLPQNFEENIIEFIEKSRGIVEDYASIVASALVMDAHTDGRMQIYGEKITACEIRLRMEGLVHDVKQRFTNIAAGMQSRQIDMQLQHLARLQGNRKIAVLGLSKIPISEYFGSVVAQDSGIFFAFALFIEDWSLPDCEYHVLRLEDQKLAKKCITFGPNLTWNLSDVLRFNKGSMLVNAGGAYISNDDTYKAMAPQTDEASFYVMKTYAVLEAFTL
ncbi:2-oxoacid dehydrogenases acyltransferase [Purpureocillium lavendulum]|uniref:2-oxoacid dehydrogenases acyltransferase n=1 Tax=Purpureocillium lavendulum TaxID=1247861 RepID=A0AB34FQ05_9HYPO|nr:2-oxoacid dehydrogenases acyltransferase [Purpureocillium lavendulum]